MNIAVYHNLISGGNKKSLYHTVQGFKRMGHRVTVYNLNISDESFAPLHEVADEVKTFHVPAPSFLRPFKLLAPLFQPLQLIPLWRVNRRIALMINRSDHDFVWVANCFVTQHPLILRYLKKPHVLYTAEHLRQYYDKVLWKYPASGYNKGGIVPTFKQLCLHSLVALRAQVDQWAIARTNHILCNSYFTAESILRFYAKKARPLYLGVDVNSYCDQHLLRDNVVLSIGSFSPLKGHDLVLEAIAQIPRPQRPKLVIVADRVDKLSAKLYCETYARNNDIAIEIRMGISEKALIETYNRAKLTVCANILEPFGMVPHESMACGTPVVAVREGGFRESVIDGETGLLVDRDARSIAQAIEHLLRHTELLQKLSYNSVRYVQEKCTHGHYFANLEREIKAVAVSALPQGKQVLCSVTKLIR
jgi:glycosyltransferase involved in cell wall biosynthesis